MLGVVGQARRIDRAVARLRTALRGVPVRGVRLTWRGGELRTTINWARDDGFWWTLQPRGESATARHALLLGHAPTAPTRRESITCEFNIARAGADRRLGGLILRDGSGGLLLGHSGRMARARAAGGNAGLQGFAGPLWRDATWPDGKCGGVFVVAPIESPRLSALLGRFVELVRRYKAGESPPAAAPHVLASSVDLEPADACDRALVLDSLAEELAKRGLFGGPRDLFSTDARVPRPLFATVDSANTPSLVHAIGGALLETARRGPSARAILLAPAATADHEGAALRRLPVACVRYRWRGARAIFDGLDAALAGA